MRLRTVRDSGGAQPISSARSMPVNPFDSSVGFHCTGEEIVIEEIKVEFEVSCISRTEYWDTFTSVAPFL